jgi:uncharacterized membrane protein
VFLAIPYVLFIPGYSLAELLLKGKKEHDIIERFVYNVGLSITVVIVVSYILNYLPWGITLVPLLIAISGFSFFCISLAMLLKRLE